jgi:stress response protein YsnF
MTQPLNQDRAVLPIVEEEATIEKKVVKRGTLRLDTRTDVVEERVREQLVGDEVEVERVAIGREVAEAPPVRTEGDVTIVPVVREELHVEKRLVLVEEIHLHRRIRTEEVDIPVELRRQSAVISRVPTTTSNSEADR